MKEKNIFKYSAITTLPGLFVVLLSLLFLFPSCNDDAEGDSFFTFTGNTIASYCEEKSNLTIFTKLMKETGNFTLLSTYGTYTCFVPNDSAFNNYFQEIGTTYDMLTLEDKSYIVNSHLIKGSKEYFVADFSEGGLPTPNINDRTLTVSYDVQGGKQMIYINKTSLITSRDNDLHNGVVHIVDKVIVPSIKYLNDVLSDYEEFSLFAEAFALTNLKDSVSAIKDESYVPASITGVLQNGSIVPVQRKYGYTLLAETNETFKKAGIETIDDLVDYATRFYGKEDMSDYTSRNNPLNKFISYHLLDRQMPTNSFLYSGATTSANAMNKRVEYYETMLKMRLLEIRASDSGTKMNVLKDGTHVALDEALSNNDAINGYVHALADVLVYDEKNMINDVLNKTIRFDFFSLAPELTNNNIRWKLLDRGTSVLPQGYCDAIQTNDATSIVMWASETWTNHQADEMLAQGWFDVTMRLLPVPPGTYEVRFGYRAEGWRGVGQLFFDGQISGIPVDLKIMGSDPAVGWVHDNETVDQGVENDKMMRNRGYMKAPSSIYSLNGPKTLRNDHMSLRKIIGTYTFQDYDYHYFRTRNVHDAQREFHFDYVEYVPVSYLDSEGID